jgi:hypothetical protein
VRPHGFHTRDRLSSGAVNSIIRSWRREPEPEPEPDPDEELRNVEMAIRQLERAELYVVSAINLELSVWEHRQALHDLRCQVLAVRDLLRRPQPLR